MNEIKSPSFKIEGLLGRMPGGSLLLLSILWHFFFWAQSYGESQLCPANTFEQKIEDHKRRSVTHSCLKGEHARAILHGPQRVLGPRGEMRQENFFWEGIRVTRREYERKLKNSSAADNSSNKALSQDKKFEITDQWQLTKVGIKEKVTVILPPDSDIKNWSVSPEDQNFAIIDFKGKEKITLIGSKVGAFNLFGYSSQGQLVSKLAVKVEAKKSINQRIEQIANEITFEQFKTNKNIPISKETSILFPFPIGNKSTLDSNYNCALRIDLENRRIILTGLKYGANQLHLYNDQDKKVETIDFLIK